jgi:hypothetical protein
MLFEINPATATLTQLFETTMIPDTQCVGFNPSDGLLYHAAGVESWGNDPAETYDIQRVSPNLVGLGFMDSHYLETINLATREFKAIFNANPPPSPDPALSAWGLVAPRPSWVLPVERRLSTQTASSYRERGTNEYHAVRGMAWSKEKQLFYIADEQGIFTLTP